MTTPDHTLAVNPLALAAAALWQAGRCARENLEAGLTASAGVWIEQLDDLARHGLPRVRALAASRRDALGRALYRQASDEVA